MNRRNSIKTKNIILRSLEVILLIIWIFPLVWMVITSIQLESDVISESLRLWPENPTFENYQKAFR